MLEIQSPLPDELEALLHGVPLPYRGASRTRAGTARGNPLAVLQDGMTRFILSPADSSRLRGL